MTSNGYYQYVITIVIMIFVMLLFEPINSVINFIGSALIVSIISWKLNEAVNQYLESNRVISSIGKAVIITGCDTGFGNGLAFKLNQLGFHTIAICLNVDSDGAKQLMNRVQFPNKLSVIQVDVTDKEKIDHSFKSITSILRDNDLKLWALVNNAGVFHIGFVEWDNNIDGYNQTFNVNTLGTIRMTRKYLPFLRSSGGRVINVLSFASRVALEGVSAYTSSKFASLAFNDTLRREMFRFGVKVISVEPSCYQTPLSEEGFVSSILDKVWSQTPNNIREDYGIESFEKFKSWYGKQSRRGRDPSEVVLALTDAVIKERPKTRYRCCGPLVSIIGSLAELLPSQMFDDFWRTINRLEVITE